MVDQLTLQRKEGVFHQNGRGDLMNKHNLLIATVTVSFSIVGTFAFTGSYKMTSLQSQVPTPTPVAEKLKVENDAEKIGSPSVPVSGQASGFGVSLPAGQLPEPRIQKEMPPREINPQNTIPIKTVKSSKVPAKTKSKLKKKRSGS